MGQGLAQLEAGRDRVPSSVIVLCALSSGRGGGGQGLTLDSARAHTRPSALFCRPAMIMTPYSRSASRGTAVRAIR